MDRRIVTLLKELRDGLQDLYGARLKGVYLYGSYARGEEDEESDVDVLIILDRIDAYGAEVDRTGYLASELSLRHDVTVSCVFTTEDRWQHEQSMFLINVRDEAIPA